MASPLAPANGAKDVSDGANAEQAALAAVHALMEENYGILNAFKANMQKCKVVENSDLLVRYRDNVVSALAQVGKMGGTMALMPPLPVKPNVELANKFLPPPGSSPAQFPPQGLVPPFPFPPGMMPPIQGMMPPMPGMMFPPGSMPLGMMPPPNMMGFPPGFLPPPGMMPPPFPMLPHQGMMPLPMDPSLAAGMRPMGVPPVMVAAASAAGPSGASNHLGRQ